MNFDQLEIYTREANEARAKNQDQMARKLISDIMKLIKEQDFVFPVNEEALIVDESATFIYKNNKTYPNLMEFIAKLLHVDIPLLVGSCKFGPGEIVVSAKNVSEAHQGLTECTRELQKLVQTKLHE
jgi:hypothetical protein